MTGEHTDLLERNYIRYTKVNFALLNVFQTFIPHTLVNK